MSTAAAQTAPNTIGQKFASLSSRGGSSGPHRAVWAAGQPAGLWTLLRARVSSNPPKISSGAQEDGTVIHLRQ